LTDFPAERQSDLLSPLAGDTYPCTTPIDILQSHLHDIASPQSQAGEQE
jgi:hypothetical protein